MQDPNNTAESAATVDQEINRSIRYYKNQRFWFNSATATITIAADTQAVPNIPSDFISELQINGLMVIDAQVRIDLEKLPPDLFFERDQDQKGRPCFYTYVDGEFLLLPTPDQAYTLKFRYLKDYPELVNNDDTNDFTNYAEDLIMLHTLKNMFAEDKQSIELADMYNKLAHDELKAVLLRSNNLNRTGFLTGKTILVDYINY